jgi:outer membrane lipoprotein SlyB
MEMTYRKLLSGIVLSTAAMMLTPSAPAADDCQNCGRVLTVKSVKVKGQSSGVGAVTGGILGGALGHQFGGGSGKTAMTVVGVAGGAYAGNEIEKNANSKLVYKVSVKMDYGEIRSFTLHGQPGFGEGDRVRVIDGRPVFHSHQ